MTVETIRKRLRKIYKREETRFRVHKVRNPEACFSSCEDAQRWWISKEILLEALEATGARTITEGL